MDATTLGAAIALAKKNAADPTVIEGAVSDWLDQHPEATTTVEDGSITKAKLNSDLQDTVDQVGELKTDFDSHEAGNIAGTNILVAQGYFSSDYKAVNNHFGTYTYKYIAADNTFIMDRDETAGTKRISIGMADSGLTLAQRLVSIADYPVCRVHVDTNIPQANNPVTKVFLYQSNGTTLNHNYTIALETGSADYVVNVAQKIADMGWANDVYYVINDYTSDSATYDFAPYIHVTNYGFYTENQVQNPNLKEIVANIKTDIDNLENAVQENAGNIAANTVLSKETGEKAASEAPLTIKQVSGILGEDGTYSGTANFISSVTDRIKCSEGDVFYYYGQCSDSVVACMWFDENGDILSFDKPSDAGYFKHITYTAPANAESVIFTSYIGVTSGYAPALVVTQKRTYTSPLSMKVWYPCGDSFTVGEFASAGISNYVFESGKYTGKNKTYPYYIGNRTNVDVRRGSVSGETMATFSGGTVVFSDPTYDYGYKSVGTDADLITLWFGINDSGRNIPIGTIDDDDNTTFYGAWNVVLDDLTTRCTKAHIGIIVSNNLAATYVDAVIAIAKKWGIPYLDLNYDNSVPLMHYSLRPDASAEIKAKRNTQFAISAENHHPNLEAHEYESYFIEKWLLSL